MVELPAAVRKTTAREDRRSAALLGVASLIGPLGGFAANIVYARTLGPDGRGDLAAVVAGLAVCEVVLVLGFPDVLTRHVARQSISAAVLRRVVIVVAVMTVIPATILGIWTYHRGFDIAPSLAVSLIVPIAATASLGRAVFAGQRRYGLLASVLLAGGLVRLAAPGILLLNDGDQKNLALLLVAASTLAAALPVFIARPFRLTNPPTVTPFPLLRREALGIWPANLAWSLNSRLDQLVLATLVAPSQLGRYAVCVTIAELPIVLAAGARQIVLVRASLRSEKKWVFKLCFGILSLGVLASGSTLAFGERIIVFVFGPDFSGLSTTLAVLLLGSAFIISGGFVNSALIASGRGYLVIASQGTGLLASVGLLLFIIPATGSILAAAAITLTTSVAVFCTASALYLKRKVQHD